MLGRLWSDKQKTGSGVWESKREILVHGSGNIDGVIVETVWRAVPELVGLILMHSIKRFLYNQSELPLRLRLTSSSLAETRNISLFPTITC